MQQPLCKTQVINENDETAERCLMKMNHAWIAVSLAAICCCAESPADEGKDILDAIQNGYQNYAGHVSKLSMRVSWSQSLNGDDMRAYTIDTMTDGRNVFSASVVLYDKYALQQKNPNLDAFASGAGISRIRGRYRQTFALRRRTPTSTWVLTRDMSEPLTKDNQSWFQEEHIAGLGQLEAVRFAPGYYITTIPQLITSPGFRLGNVTEDRTGPERLVTVEFTIDPPLDPKEARRTSWVQAGRMQLRPDAYWTLKSGTFHVQASSYSGQVVQWKVTNTFDEDSENKALPKEVTCVSTVITKDGKKAGEILRGTFEWSSYTQVPEERLSLTQFGMSEREPIDAKGEPGVEAGTAPSAERDTKNYLAVSRGYSVPAYVWITAAGVLLLVVGLALRVWMTKSAKMRDAAVPPPPSAPG